MGRSPREGSFLVSRIALRLVICVLAIGAYDQDEFQPGESVDVEMRSALPVR